MQVLHGVAQAWQTQRAEIVAQKRLDARRAGGQRWSVAARGELDTQPIDAAIADIQRGFDPVHGGFSRAPKFPRPAELTLLFWSQHAEARGNVLMTLEKMARGGLMDQTRRRLFSLFDG
jgi:uncharacterized protein